MNMSASADKAARVRNVQQEECLLKSIYEDYGTLLKKLAISNGAKPYEVEDIVQDSIVSYYLAYELNLPEREKKALLGRILINKCRDLYRKNKNYEMTGLNSAEDEAELMGTCLLAEDTLQYIIKHEIYRAVLKEILSMKKIWRDVMFLHMVEGKSEKEVAQILDITETACRVRISRARDHLRGVMKDWFID